MMFDVLYTLNGPRAHQRLSGTEKDQPPIRHADVENWHPWIKWNLAPI